MSLATALEAGSTDAGPGAHPGLWPSAWPAEDGGPRRTQTAEGTGLGIAPGESLRLAASRDAFAATMVVSRDPGELYLLRHTLGRRPFRDPVSAWVERIDPATLAPLERSQELSSGPFWPGGMAAHANGSIHVVTGRYCHRLSADLELLGSRELTRESPHNSFVVLADGTLALKDFDRGLRRPALLTLLDPGTLETRAELELPEPVVARLAADGNSIYAVGATTLWRCNWDGSRLELDPAFGYGYATPDHSYGWDPVIAGGSAWFLDNGAHDYSTSMLGVGVASGAVRLHRVGLDDPSDCESVEVCGAAHGAVTDPPLFDVRRRIAIAYDSANGVVGAFRLEDKLRPLWRRRLAHAAHMILFSQTGELVLGDHAPPAFARTRLGRFAGRHLTAPARSARLRRALARRGGDDVVVVDVESGVERGRARVPSMFQSVLFPAPGFARDLYWCTFSTLARIEVA
jgi:hypothetical protein